MKKANSKKDITFKSEQKRFVILLGERCRETRKKNFMSQKEVAENLKTTQVTISKFERGKIDSLSIYFMYCLLFGDII